ncbi:MAG: FG-GAP-like repeat-containing protein, partial [Candidatus Eisenbacteria bacterium]|nr:FG-GAP-like repeat-containing protein [Candidatus Eisenbacteria bacterium]
MKRLSPWSLKACLGMLVLAGISFASIFLATVGPDDEGRDEGDRPDNPGGLMRERWEMMTAGDTTVTAQAFIVAKNQLVAMAAAAAEQSGGIGPLDAGLATWEWLGPQNIGGRTRAILFDPNDSNHLWAGSATGGISTSSDGGLTWSLIDDFLPSLSVPCLAIDPTTGFLFAGTGEFAVSLTATGGGFMGAGIFRSTDGGATWNQLATTASYTQVSRIAVVPADGFIFAATGSGLIRSSDSGLTWPKVLNNSSLRDVKATPTSHLVLVGGWGGAFRSTNSGATWDTLTTGATGLLPVTPGPLEGRIEFAIASDQLTCYASIDRNGGEVWRSLDAGATWQLRRTGDQYLRDQGWYDNVIWVDPTNANTVVIGGVDTWRSTNGGSSFLPLSDWQQYPPNSAHADHHAIVSPPNYDGATRRSVYFGNDGGIQRKDDILAGPNDWTDLSNGLKSSQFYKGAVQRIGTEVMGGLQDNGTWRYSGNINWNRQWGGDGSYCSYDASESNLYWQTQNMQIYKELFSFPLPSMNGLTDAGNTCKTMFIAPLKADPVIAGRVFAGGSSIWLTTDYAEHWSSIRGLVNPTDDGPPCGTVGALCSAIELVATNSSLVWVGYNDGTVSRSTDGGTTWTDVDAGSTPLPDRFVTDIAINAANTSEVYVTFGGFSSNNVWFTSNAGTTWTNRSGSGSTALPTAPVETITVHPSNSAWIYAGTAVGVLASEDRGLTWGVTRRYPQSEGPAYTQVSDLIWQGNKLIAFTYGRGVWRSGPIAGTSSAPSFSKLSTSFTGVNAGSCDWGDYDNDGDLDVLWTGRPTSPDNAGPGVPITRIGRNDGGMNFAVLNAFIPGVVDGAARWGDYDRDGDLDIVITGTLSSGVPIARLYRNNGGGSFSIVSASLEPVYASDEAWGDFDNDGDLDLVISGHTGATSTNGGSTYLYRNVDGILSNIGGTLNTLWHSSVAWGDFDNDGDLDLLVAGRLDGTSDPGTLLYRNDGGTLTNITFGLGLPNVDESAQWGDYDQDGDLDMLLLGVNGLFVHRNNGNGTFTTAATLAGQVDGAAAWGDFDSDGDQDIAVSGKDGISNATRLYRNNSGTFVEMGAHWNGARKSALAWGDCDNDGDLDLSLSGWANVASVAQIYRNDSAIANSAPSAPGGLSVTTGACGPGGVPVTFSWTAAYDDHTSELGYNLRVGTSPGAGNVVPAMSSSSTGFRHVAALGNAQMRRSWTLTLPVGIYYWSVQAIDGSYKASAFASEATATISATFTNAAVALQPIDNAACWGDFDGDDDLDLLLTGSESSTVYRNDGGPFTALSAGLPGVDYSAAAWGDYDNDGDLDFVLAGCNGGGYITLIYRNDSGAFVDIGAGLTGVCGALLAWGDCDNDGDLDLLVAGATGSDIVSLVYANNGGFFSDIGASLAGVYFGSAAWADYDNDGDRDLLLTGLDGVSAPHTDLYRNGGNGDLVLVPIGLPPVYLGTVAWDDYDNDGDLDLLLTGSTGGSPDQIARVYRNNGTGVLTDIAAGLPGVQQGSGNWGDVNNDGRLDVLLTGYNPTIGLLSRLYLG